MILNAEPESFAQGYFQLHGPALCAVGLRTGDEVQALARATALLATQFEGRVGPNELMRSRAVVRENRSVRITLNASEGRHSMIARSLSTFAGPGVHHIAFACDDIFATVARLKAAGVAFLAMPDNYYDDLEAGFGELGGLVARLREAGILYDRTADGTFFTSRPRPSWTDSRSRSSNGRSDMTATAK